MTWSCSRNISFATAASLLELSCKGEEIVVRGAEVREVRNRVSVLTVPRERCLFVPFRGNSIIASITETLWVLAGRNDVGWLSNYLPRASDYSDDGRTWRGAYGPRLRNWQGTDQLAKVRSLLLADLASRRAVMSIFDPARDFANSKDIPCNNWLHWMVRGNRLHLNVAVRSNDVWWGFSGVNSFEWSVLLELMSHWLRIPTGELTFFASSLHLYQRHYGMAARALAAFRGVSCYDYGVEPAAITTPWESFDKALADWFGLEEEVRHDPDLPVASDRLPADAFLRTSLLLVRAEMGVRSGWSDQRLSEELALLPENDLTAAGYEYFGRERASILRDIRHHRIALFLEAYDTLETTSARIQADRIKAGIKSLHQTKDAAYGNAWKRRGELVSTVANIARKVDRLENSARTSAALADESVLDTAVDLFVYLTKYRLLLLESFTETLGARLLRGGAEPYSDYASNFETLVDALPAATPTDDTVAALVHDIIGRFEHLNGLEIDTRDRRERLESVDTLASLAWRLILALARAQPDRLGHFAL